MLSKILSNGVLSLLDNQWQLDKPWHPIWDACSPAQTYRFCRFVWGCTHQHLPLMISKHKTAERVKTSFWLGKNSKLDPFCFESCWHSAFMAGYLQIWSVFSQWKAYHIIHSNPFKIVRVRDSCFFTKWRNILVWRLTKRCQGCLVVPAVCTEHRFAKMSTRRWWAIIPRDFMTWCSLSICGWTPTEKWWGIPGYPYRWWLFTSFTFSCSQNLTWNRRCPKIHANF